MECTNKEKCGVDGCEKGHHRADAAGITFTKGRTGNRAESECSMIIMPVDTGRGKINIIWELP